MTELEKWKFDFAWKQLENAQNENEKLNNKAMSVINFASLIIPIIIGILFYAINISYSIVWFYFFMIEGLFFFISSIIFAFIAILLRNQGIISTNVQFEAFGNDDIDTVIGKTSQDIADWQDSVLAVGKSKAMFIQISDVFFIFALILISLGGGCLFF